MIRNAVRPRAAAERVVVMSVVAVATVALGATFARAATLGQTTVDHRIVPSTSAGFRTLGIGPGQGYVVREDGLGVAQAGREGRRTSLAYFGQLSDFQLADEESPARVEFVEYGPFSAAWRPSEALNPQIDDAMIRQLNAFSGASPVADGKRSPPRDGLHDQHR